MVWKTFEGELILCLALTVNVSRSYRVVTNHINQNDSIIEIPHFAQNDS